LVLRIFYGLILVAVVTLVLAMGSQRLGVPTPSGPSQGAAASSSEVTQAIPDPAAGPRRPRQYQPRQPIETSGFPDILAQLRWAPNSSSLEKIREGWQAGPRKAMAVFDLALPPPGKSDSHRLGVLVAKVNVLNFQGEPDRAYELLEQTRSWVEQYDALAEFGLYSIIYFQGVTALRRGETDNCVRCRGESSCIIPIAPSAVHTNPTGSRLAIKHFTEYLAQFPDDLAARWLLNVGHMTLGEYPEKVDSRYRLRLDRFFQSEFDIGKFCDIGQKAGVNRFNMAGGAVLEDFDNDGRLDLAATTSDPSEPMRYYRNAGDGTFQDLSEPAGLTGLLGGKNLVQTDYNNDGRMDLFISRGAWFLLPMPQTLLQNAGNGKFVDVTRQAGLDTQVNSTASRWADYDNDGWLDVFVLAERQPSQLYHNRGDGTFEPVTARAGLQAVSGFLKGAAWIDYDNDDYPDLFVDDLQGDARLFHNDGKGRFTDVTKSLGIDGPRYGFSCWAWDYDNDGWLDLFATCYDLTLADIVKGLIGQPHDRLSNRLFRNVNGKHFVNKTKEAGLDLVFAAMGSNFGDFDNDGYLDFYLGTGATDLGALVPNRMFKNVGGRRFAEITASSGTGHLQKGHGVSCGDWDRDGDVDIFIEMGGAVPGDRYHNILFQNPGQGNHWLTVKLVGQTTNRAAIGARIKVVTAGEAPLTVHRHVSSGSSWGANPLEQHIGLAGSRKVALLEVHWPTSGTTQVFRDIAADQAIEVTEFAKDYRKLDWKPIPAPR
jgi:hypothetical protein